eukprot:1947697-Alexandrium_andersonii.AAC.1
MSTEGVRARHVCNAWCVRVSVCAACAVCSARGEAHSAALNVRGSHVLVCKDMQNASETRIANAE